MGVEVVNQEAAATILQYAWRRKKAYMILGYLMGERDKVLLIRWNAAIVIQTYER
jgi:hypothetical protein